MTVKYDLIFVLHKDGNGHIDLRQENKRKKDPKNPIEIKNPGYETLEEKEIDEFEGEQDSEGKSKRKKVIYEFHRLYLFRFDLKREKSKITKIEQLKIEVFRMDKAYGGLPPT